MSQIKPIGVKMLKNDVEPQDLLNKAEEFRKLIPSDIEFEVPSEDKVLEIKYPVLEHPKTVKSFNFDKDPLVEGVLMGIKGQYLIFDKAVINIRKYNGYKVSVSAEL